MLAVEDLLVKYADAPFVVLSDFDGTISTEDSNDHVIDLYGMGPVARRALWSKVVTGEDGANFRDAFRTSLESVRDALAFDECVDILRKAIKLDPGFVGFSQWCRAQSPPVPLILVSSGMEPIIRGILAEHLGDDEAADIDIVSNDVALGEGKHDWAITYRHPESGFGHDKSQAILPFKALAHRPLLFFCGDGISDMSAAKHADVLFVKNKEGNDLATYCDLNKYPYKLFDTFDNVLADVRDVVAGVKAPADVMTVPA